MALTMQGRMGRFSPVSVRYLNGVTYAVAAAVMAPVAPAEKKPAASPFLTARHASTMEDLRLCMTASMGSSSMVMTSGATSALTRSRFSANGSTISAGPTASTSRSASAASAASMPSSTTCGSSSPPITSTAMRTLFMETPPT